MTDWSYAIRKRWEHMREDDYWTKYRKRLRHMRKNGGRLIPTKKARARFRTFAGRPDVHGWFWRFYEA